MIWQSQPINKLVTTDVQKRLSRVLGLIPRRMSITLAIPSSSEQHSRINRSPDSQRVESCRTTAGSNSSIIQVPCQRLLDGHHQLDRFYDILQAPEDLD